MEKPYRRAVAWCDAEAFEADGLFKPFYRKNVLKFRKGDEIEVIEIVAGRKYWRGRLDGKEGVFPSKAVTLLFETGAAEDADKVVPERSNPNERKLNDCVMSNHSRFSYEHNIAERAPKENLLDLHSNTVKKASWLDALSEEVIKSKRDPDNNQTADESLTTAIDTRAIKHVNIEGNSKVVAMDTENDVDASALTTRTSALVDRISRASEKVQELRLCADEDFDDRTAILLEDAISSDDSLDGDASESVATHVSSTARPDEDVLSRRDVEEMLRLHSKENTEAVEVSLQRIREQRSMMNEADVRVALEIQNAVVQKSAQDAAVLAATLVTSKLRSEIDEMERCVAKLKVGVHGTNDAIEENNSAEGVPRTLFATSPGGLEFKGTNTNQDDDTTLREVAAEFRDERFRLERSAEEDRLRAERARDELLLTKATVFEDSVHAVENEANEMRSEYDLRHAESTEAAHTHFAVKEEAILSSAEASMHDVTIAASLDERADQLMREKNAAIAKIQESRAREMAEIDSTVATQVRALNEREIAAAEEILMSHGTKTIEMNDGWTSKMRALEIAERNALTALHAARSQKGSIASAVTAAGTDELDGGEKKNDNNDSGETSRDSRASTPSVAVSERTSLSEAGVSPSPVDDEPENFTKMNDSMCEGAKKNVVRSEIAPSSVLETDLRNSLSTLLSDEYCEVPSRASKSVYEACLQSMHVERKRSGREIAKMTLLSNAPRTIRALQVTNEICPIVAHRSGNRRHRAANTTKTPPHAIAGKVAGRQIKERRVTAASSTKKMRNSKKKMEVAVDHATAHTVVTDSRRMREILAGGGYLSQSFDGSIEIYGRADAISLPKPVERVSKHEMRNKNRTKKQERTRKESSSEPFWVWVQ